MDELLNPILVVAALVLVLWLYIFLPAQMAGRRNRSMLVWVLISLVGSPLLAVLLLIALGDAKT